MELVKNFIFAFLSFTYMKGKMHEMGNILTHLKEKSMKDNSLIVSNLNPNIHILEFLLIQISSLSKLWFYVSVFET